MQVNINTADIEAAVKDAIIQSAIGEKIKKSVNDLLFKGWDNPIDKAVNEVILDIARMKVREIYGQQIEDALKAKCTPEIMEELVSKLWDQRFGN